MSKPIEKFRNCMEEAQVDAFFVHKPENVLYLSGFSGSCGGIFLTSDKNYLLVDSRYETQAKEECPEWEVVLSQRPWLIKDILRTEKVIGFEEDFLTVQVYRELCVQVGDKVTLQAVGAEIAQLRKIKDAAELALLQKAVDIADDAFHHILSFIGDGVLEIDIASELDFYMRKQGASGPSFQFIVAGGTRSALPHGVATAKPLKAHEPVLLDYGCVYQHYCSDMTRTVFIDEPGPELRQFYYVVKEGQQRALRKAFPGVPLSSAEKVVRSYFDQLELGAYFGHSLGHGVGLEIHEAPTVNKENEEVFAPGMVFTIEPGIYIPAVGGIRIEDMVYMSKSGAVTMTGSPKDLIIL